METRYKTELGNALWFILVAIALLGLLTVMMSRSSSTSNETGSYEQNIIHANDILNYAKSIEIAAQNLFARSCGENDISFWHDSDGNSTEDGGDDYYNADSPTDHSCHIFDVAGAGMTLPEPNESWLDRSLSANFNYQEFEFSSVNQIKNLEQDGRDDLIIFIDWVSLGVCQAINHILYSNNTITEDPDSFNYGPSADGTYDSIAEVIDLSTTAAHDGRPSACFTSQDEGGYHFYHVLHAR